MQFRDEVVERDVDGGLRGGVLLHDAVHRGVGGVDVVRIVGQRVEQVGQDGLDGGGRLAVVA